MYPSNLHSKKLRSRMLRLLRKNRRIATCSKRILNVDRHLRDQNVNLVKELQKERLKNQALYADLNHLQIENLQYMNAVGAIREAQSCLNSEVPQMESCARDLATAMIHASGYLAQLQNSCSKIRNQMLVLPGQNASSYTSGSPAFPCFVSSNGRRRMNPEIFPKSLGETLNVIEEVSHENSIISPQVRAKRSTRYERKCKKGLRHLISAKPSLSRKSLTKSPKSNNLSANSEADEHPRGVNAETNESKQCISNEESSPKIDNTHEGSTMELTPSINASSKSEDTASSQGESTPSTTFSIGSISSKSSISLNITATPRRYSDVLKSTKKYDNERIENESTVLNSDSGSRMEQTSPASVVENRTLKTPLKSSNIESSLQRITLRRGASNRKASKADNKIDGVSCNVSKTPVNITCKSEPVDLLEDKENSYKSSTPRISNSRTPSTFSFYVFPDQSCKKESIDSDANSTIKASASATDKKKKFEKQKLNSNSRTSSYSSRMSVNESNIAANVVGSGKVFNSTPIDLVKPQEKGKRKPLAVIVSSTHLGLNDSAMSQGSTINPDSELCLSPIPKCSYTENNMRDHTTVHSTSENSGSYSSVGHSGRPRRNATKSNYKEPSLHQKMRR